MKVYMFRFINIPPTNQARDHLDTPHAARAGQWGPCYDSAWKSIGKNKQNKNKNKNKQQQQKKKKKQKKKKTKKNNNKTTTNKQMWFRWEVFP